MVFWADIRLEDFLVLARLRRVRTLLINSQHSWTPPPLPPQNWITPPDSIIISPLQPRVRLSWGHLDCWQRTVSSAPRTAPQQAEADTSGPSVICYVTGRLDSCRVWLENTQQPCIQPCIRPCIRPFIQPCIQPCTLRGQQLRGTAGCSRRLSKRATLPRNNSTNTNISAAELISVATGQLWAWMHFSSGADLIND